MYIKIAIISDSVGIRLLQSYGDPKFKIFCNTFASCEFGNIKIFSKSD